MIILDFDPRDGRAQHHYVFRVNIRRAMEWKP